MKVKSDYNSLSICRQCQLHSTLAFFLTRTFESLSTLFIVSCWSLDSSIKTYSIFSKGSFFDFPLGLFHVEITELEMMWKWPLQMTIQQLFELALSIFRMMVASFCFPDLYLLMIHACWISALYYANIPNCLKNQIKYKYVNFCNVATHGCSVLFPKGTRQLT